MSWLHSRWLLFALCLSVLIGAIALADIPPPDDYVETCTLAIQQGTGEECAECSAWHGDPGICQRELGSQGFEWRCRAYGASVWTEIWCKPAVEPEGTGQPEAEPEPIPAPPMEEEMELAPARRPRSTPAPASAPPPPGTPSLPGDM